MALKKGKSSFTSTMDLLPLILGFLWALTASVQNAIKNIMMFFTITNLIIIPAKNKSS
jgi:hypothetical protein